MDFTEYNEWEQTPEAEDAPYVVHHVGPDDILPARTWKEASEIAHAINAQIVDYNGRSRLPDGTARYWATPYRREDAKNTGVIS